MENILPFIVGLLLGMCFKGSLKIGLININKDGE
jgi:hypothetical protein